MAYDSSPKHAIMLAEPAMLLLYKTCEYNPSLTDTLIAYLGKALRLDEEEIAVPQPSNRNFLCGSQQRKYQLMRSVQTALQDC